ncbi:MAG: SOS cell division inhibitor [Marinobacter sp.]|uniref:SOS cell division inhibitor n=1 Tax=Marinobacter sp. TaxID=50741 RepID=UPI00299E2A08|nr:SOS cell division inhibitor [Marinobacter sp.]MDX1757588.1 SOS cell division inhibitor [Marinobacter sp.]
MSFSLEQLDTLNDELRRALVSEHWERFSELNGQIQPTVDRVMADLRSGDLHSGAVQERLETLQSLCNQAREGAEQAREAARIALKDVNRNRQATRAYHNVQDGPAG